MTFSTDQYQLLDFGNGQKIERFSDVVIRRTTPSVTRREQCLGHWKPDLEFREIDGDKCWAGATPENWQVCHGHQVFNLRTTPAGQVGLFPEQVTIWELIENHAEVIRGSSSLNLFAYTGGTTQALAAAGADVVHVDSAQNVVKWAKQNYLDSSIDSSRVRWIRDDALKFAEREIRRGSKYDILVADPPSYGKGPKRETWKFKRDIETLIAYFVKLASPRLKMVVLSSHTPGFNTEVLRELLSAGFANWEGSFSSRKLYLKTESGKRLFSGDCALFLSSELKKTTA